MKPRSREERGEDASYLPLVVLRFLLQANAPVLADDLGAVGYRHGNRGGQVQAWGAVRDLRPQQDFASL